jgi:hypothetical protein
MRRQYLQIRKYHLFRNFILASGVQVEPHVLEKGFGLVNFWEQLRLLVVHLGCFTIHTLVLEVWQIAQFIQDLFKTFPVGRGVILTLLFRAENRCNELLEDALSLELLIELIRLDLVSRYESFRMRFEHRLGS